MFGRRNKREGSFQELVDLLDATDDPGVILGLFLMLRQRLPELRAGDPAIGAAIAPVHRAVLDGRLTDGLAITEGLRLWRELATTPLG